jgi:glycosyltransferase involved in cell wall biosynthesis
MLSVILIVKNEEKLIKQCLSNIKWADEIIIVDDFSTDNTCKIAKEFTTKIYKKHLTSFGEQKNFALSKAKGDWILSIDADEIFDKEAVKAIKKIINSKKDSEPAGYKIYRKTYYIGKIIENLGWYGSVIRLFKKVHGSFTNKKVHEEIIINGPVSVIEGHIIHYSYLSLKQAFKKQLLYGEFEFEHDIITKTKFTRFKKYKFLIYRPIKRFLTMFIQRKGYKDGIRGLIISICDGFREFYKWARIWEERYKKDLEK